MCSKKTFVTFCNSDFMTTDRIVSQAKNFNIFDEIYGCNENDIKTFIEKHNDFIKSHPSGFGNWIWKPKIIYDKLLELKENDILVYCDAGVYLNNNGIQRLNEYFSFLNNENNDLITFSTSNLYTSKQWVKMDAIMDYYPEFNIYCLDNIACYAGLMIIKKTDKSLNLIKDWLELCENYHFIDRSVSVNYNEADYFIGQDCDNGLFNLCLAKYKINYAIYPDETNLYNSEGYQIIHCNQDINSHDWISLADKPFQNRRITPKFYSKNDC